jgi:hypothetical protein
MPTARIVMRPVDNAAARIVFKLAFYRDDVAGLNRHGTGNIDICFHAQQKIALLVELKQKAFVFAAPSVARAEDGNHSALSDDLNVARSAAIEPTDLRVIRLLGCATAARRAEERECEG